MREDLTIDEVMEVARLHSIRVAAGWSGFSIYQIRRLRREEGFERGHGHPSREEMEREKPRTDCRCRFCLDTRIAIAKELTSHRNRAYGRIKELIGDDAPWKAEGLCRGISPDLFYPTISDLRLWDETEAPGMRVCDGCPVKAECLEYALANNERDGVWGGLCPTRRRKLLKQRAASS